MPNLTLKISRAIDGAYPPAPDLLDEIETGLCGALGVKPGACNIMAVETTSGRLSAPVYLELVYRSSDERTPEAMREVARELARILHRHFGVDIAFRGFPCGPQSIVAADFSGAELTE